MTAVATRDETDKSEGFLELLRNCGQPADVGAALSQLIRSFAAPAAGDIIFLTPATIRQLLSLLVERTDDAWLEVRKKISFLFSDLVLRGHGDVLADAIIYGEPRTTAGAEARASHIDFSDALREPPDAAAVLGQLRYFLEKLALAHSTVERCVPAAEVFRIFLRVPALLEIILSPEKLCSGTLEKKSSQQSNSKREQFHESCIGILCRGVESYTTVLCVETWRSLTGALYTNKNLSASLLMYYFDEFVGVFIQCLKGRNFIARLNALELLATILEDSAFLKARKKYAESPALLCALLPLTNSSSAHIRFLTFDALKVFIAKGNKPAPIRYLIYINRDMLARYLEEYSTGDAAINKRLELEKQKLLQSLIFLEPLTHEEELFLGVS